MPLQLTAPVTNWDLENFDQDTPQHATFPSSDLERTLRTEINHLRAELSTSQTEHRAKDEKIQRLSGLVKNLSQGILDFLNGASSTLKETSPQEAASRTGHLITESQQTFTDLIKQCLGRGNAGSNS